MLRMQKGMMQLRLLLPELILGETQSESPCKHMHGKGDNLYVIGFHQISTFLMLVRSFGSSVALSTSKFGVIQIKFPLYFTIVSVEFVEMKIYFLISFRYKSLMCMLHLPPWTRRLIGLND